MLLNVFEVGRACLVGCGSILKPGTFFLGDLVMKKIYDYSLHSLPSLFKKGSCRLLAKEYALSTGKLPRRLAQGVWIVLPDRARNGLKCVEVP